jgi:hypothetical protein
MTEPMIEQTEAQTEPLTDELSDEALDRDETNFGSGWTFTSCMS